MMSSHHRPALSIAAVSVASALFAAPAFVSAQSRTPVPVAPDIDAAYTKLTAAPQVRKVLDDLKADDARTQRELRLMTEIEAPPFKERDRAEYVVSRMKALGLEAAIDGEGNVVGLRKGNGGGPTLLVSAHLDTVFPPGTDVKVKEKDGKWYAPGIADDTRGLAVLLSWLKVLNDNKVQTIGDLVFVANVGEEGLGDLRGMKVGFKNMPGIDGMVGLEPGPGSAITTIGTASHRYEVRFTGPGGHSFEAFGTTSAIHAMGRAIAKIDEIQVPKQPKTTFNVGRVGGGTSVNSIPFEGWMEVDMRSSDPASLANVDASFQKAVDSAVQEENARWGKPSMITAVKELVGDRPAGSTPENSPIVRTGLAVATQLGFSANLGEGSTDSNIPMSLKIPGITVGGGGRGRDAHSLNES